MYVCTKLSNQWRDSKIARLFWVYIVLVIYKFVARHHVCTRWRQTKVFEYLIIGILHPVLGWKLVIIYSMFSSFKGWHMVLAICSSKWIILPWWTSAVRVFKSQGMVTTLRGKHCQHPIAIMGVVDMFGLIHLLLQIAKNICHPLKELSIL